MRFIGATLAAACLAGAFDAAFSAEAPAGPQSRGAAPVTTSAPPLVTTYEAAMVMPPPAALTLDEFYTRYADAFGIPIVGSAQVDAPALLIARDIVNYMLAKRPDLRAELIARGSRIMIIAQEEQQTDLPEYRTMRKPAKDDPRLTPSERERYDLPGGIGSQTDQQYWNRRARGLGGIRTSCAEENLLGVPGTRYYGEHICVHEFSHGIMSAIRAADPALMQAIQSAYDAAKAAGRFGRHYAENTVAEYWAEGTQWWFWSNYPWTPAGGPEIWSPDSLKAYDLALYDVLSRVYLDHRIPADVYHGRRVR